MLYKFQELLYILGHYIPILSIMSSNTWECGYRLFLMLRRFPIESKGRRKKLREVCSPSLDRVKECLTSALMSSTSLKYIKSENIHQYEYQFGTLVIEKMYLPCLVVPTIPIFSWILFSMSLIYVVLHMWTLKLNLKFLMGAVQVGCVTAICFTCFTIRSFIVSSKVMHPRLHWCKYTISNQNLNNLYSVMRWTLPTGRKPWSWWLRIPGQVRISDVCRCAAVCSFCMTCLFCVMILGRLFLNTYSPSGHDRWPSLCLIRLLIWMFSTILFWMPSTTRYAMMELHLPSTHYYHCGACM